MTALMSLKFVSELRPSHVVPVVQRRNRLISKLWEQIQLAKAEQAGSTFAPMHSRALKNPETGERLKVEMPKRIKPWWFTAENGKVCLNVKYGTKVIEFAKGKSAVEVGAMSNLVPVLETLKAAVAAGEIDAQIELISNRLRAGFSTK